MKKILLFLILAFSFHYSKAQFCNVSLLPNQAFRGQTLTTTVTNNQLFMGYGSAPCNPGDIRLYQSSSGTTIYANSLAVVGDSIYVGWNIPANAPNGGYDLYMDQYLYDPGFGNCIVGPVQCYSSQAFGIGASIISGVAYFDSNLDSVYNAGDFLIPNKRIMLLPDSLITFTNSNGYYQFFADTGAHTIVVSPDIYYLPYSSDSINIQLTQNNSTNHDFAFTQSAAAYNTTLNISGRARCNTTQTYNHYYFNHSLIPVDLLIKIYYSGNLVLQTSPVVPDSIVGDTLYYGFQNVTLAQGNIFINFLIPAAGNQVSFNAISVVYNQSGTIMSTNANKYDQTVSCSWDPNDKAVNPAGEGTDHYTLFSEELIYTIRFQNTGNDTAYDVHILDTIDANLDFSTFRLLSSSHPVTVVATFDGIVDFRFYNIMLPDSNVNNPGSNGYVMYSIMSDQGLPEKTVVRNTAHIYFDSNPPVTTNTVDNSMVTSIPVGIKGLPASRDFVFYPNPFSGQVTLVNVNQLPFNCMLTVYDTQGRILITERLTNGRATVNLQGLAPGIYTCRLEEKENGLVHIGRLIKQ